LGQRLIDGVAKSMAEDFFKRFDQEMQRQYPPAEVPATPVVQASASEGGFKLPAWGWVVGAVVLALAVWFLR
jgi:hypothetical protein